MPSPIISGLRDALAGRFASVTFTIPMPPSTNELFIMFRGKRVKTSKYSAWLKEAGWQIKAQHVPSISGDVKVSFLLERKSKCADVDNRIKAALDLLVKQGVIEDDRRVMKVSAEWTSSGGCVVTIKPWTNPSDLQMAG